MYAILHTFIQLKKVPAKLQLFCNFSLATQTLGMVAQCWLRLPRMLELGMGWWLLCAEQLGVVQPLAQWRRSPVARCGMPRTLHSYPRPLPHAVALKPDPLCGAFPPVQSKPGQGSVQWSHTLSKSSDLLLLPPPFQQLFPVKFWKQKYSSRSGLGPASMYILF